MKRALGLALLIAALAPAAAGAAVPGPTILDFEDQALGDAVGFSDNPGAVYANRTDVVVSDGDSCGQVAAPDAAVGSRYVQGSCTPRLRFSSPQAIVKGFIRFSAETSGSSPTVNVIGFRADDSVAAVVPVNNPTSWTTFKFTSPDPSPSITRIQINADRFVDFDDIGFSPNAVARTWISRRARREPWPPETRRSRSRATSPAWRSSASSTTSRPRPVVHRSRTAGSPRVEHNVHGHRPRPMGRATTPVRPGRTWTVEPAAPPSDRDLDGVADGSDNCPDNANSGQGDSDRDGVGDACELLPSGNTPIEAGKAATVKLLSGDVFVKLPPGATNSAFTGDLRVPFQSSGFLPLKGVAAVPMGSTLDTRKGEVALTAAINGQPARSRKQKRREARFRAGIFQIKQARKKRKQKASKTIPPSATLASPAGAEAPCRPRGPGKGIAVRSLSMTAKGVFRAVGGAATASPAKGTATFITTDRCDGTVTEVGRGSVAVIAKKGGKRKVVKAGRAYIVRARLFQAKRNRRG